MGWKRPASVSVGQVWSRFEGNARNNRPARKYQIRDMEEKYKEKCLNLLNTTFMMDEPLGDSLDITKDPVSLSTINATWENEIAKGVSLACFTETDGEPDELVGFNMLLVKCRGDEEEDIDQIQGESRKKMLLTIRKAKQLVDVFSVYGVDKYLSSSGLTVLQDHRGQNIGSRLLEARKPLCRALGLQATVTMFTSTAAQIAAKKAGFDQLAEFKYTDMAAYGIDLSGCANPTAKVMGTKFNFE